METPIRLSRVRDLNFLSTLTASLSCAIRNMSPHSGCTGDRSHTSRRIVSVRFDRDKSSWAFRFISSSTVEVRQALQQALMNTAHGLPEDIDTLECLYPETIDSDANELCQGSFQFEEIELRAHIVDVLTTLLINEPPRRSAGIVFSDHSVRGALPRSDLAAHERPFGNELDTCDGFDAAEPNYILSSPSRVWEVSEWDRGNREWVVLEVCCGRTCVFDLSVFDKACSASGFDMMTGWWQAFRDTKEKWSLSSNADVADFLLKTLATHPPTPAPGRAEA